MEEPSLFLTNQTPDSSGRQKPADVIRRGKKSPPPCSLFARTHCSRKVEHLLAQASPPCWIGAGAFGVLAAWGRGAPPGTPAPNSGPPGERMAAATRPAGLPLRGFCWGSCKIEVALLRCTRTGGTCCSRQGRGMQRVPPRAQGRSTCSRGAGHPVPVQPPFPSSGTRSKGKARPWYFTFLLGKK